MKEPLRLRDPRSQASPALRALLAVAEPPAPLSAATRERVRGARSRRAAATERRAVCWSHAFGFALALATCLVWLLPQRAPDDERSIARTRSTSGAATPRLAAATKAHEVGPPAPVQTHVEVADAAQGTAATHVRRAAPGKRWAAGPARSRKRIAAVVDGILKPEAQQLDRARREAERDPEQALALIDAFRRDHPGRLPAPIAVAEVDALRRLGRFEEAVAKARALLESSPRPYYADQMAERFALLDL